MITPVTFIRSEDHLPQYMRTTGRNRLPMKTRTPYPIFYSWK